MKFRSKWPSKLLLAASTLALTCLVSQAGFTPIPLNTNSYNHDVVVEATAPKLLNDVVNVTMDGGTNKSGNTFYEQGYNASAPLTGIPPAGSTFTAMNPPSHVFQMPPDYHVNNAVMVGHHNGQRTPIMTGGTLTLTTPASFSSLSFLTCSGNGPVLVGYVVHYADSSTESNTFSSLDWFNAAANATNAAGRVSTGGGVANVNGSPAGALFAVDVLLGSLANVTSIEFHYAGSGGNNNTNNNGRAVIFAVSGSSDNVNFSPIAVTGYTHDPVVEADGPKTTGIAAAALEGAILTNYVTATMDGGLSKANNCWYEQGYYASFPATGIPAAGSTVSSATLPGTSYVMPPTYATNCAVLLSSNVTSANIILANGAAYGALSFLCATANGDTFLPCVISFQDGSTETNVVFVPDWFNRDLPWSYLSFGRVNPNNRTANNTPDLFVNPFATAYPGPGAYDYRGLGLPTCRFFDAVINITNSTGVITNIALTHTNTAATGARVAAIFAVSGAPTASVPPIFGYRGTTTPGQPANARVNNITLLKAWEGTNNVVLAVTNIAGTAPISYQWKKAPRGGGLRDMFYTFDYSTFANVVDGGRYSGANSSVLVISNALTADSADYLVVASNAGGSVTSLVATVMVLTTNQSLLVGKPAGDVIANYTGDGSPLAESIDHASDRVAQKWLSWGMNNQVLPFYGPVGYTVTPVSGASIVTSMRVFTANDSSGRDPYDYALEGSNDGATWAPITSGVLKGTLSLPTGRNGTGSTAVDALNQNCVEVDFANAIGYKSYRVTITNNYNRTGDSLMQVAEVELLGTLVPNPPVWVRHPNANVTVFVGASPSFTVQASSYPLPKYQWYKNGTTLIPDATNATYTFPNAQLTDSGTTFHCTAANNFGTITSSSATLTVISAPAQLYPASVLADNPVGYWRLGESPDNGSGNNGVVARDSRGGHNGYYTNSVIAAQGYNSAGDPDTAATFGTLFGGPIYSNSYVADIKDLSFARATNAGPAAFSVEAWVLGGNQIASSAIVSKGYNGALNAGTGTGTEQFVLDVGTGNFPAFRFLVRDAAGNGHVAQSTVVPYSSVTLGPVWRHLVGVCDQANGKVYLYVDGILAATGDIGTSAGILEQLLPMTIGARQSGGATEFDNQWAGNIDDVAVYGTALSASQVLSHFYAAQRPPIISLQPTNQITPENVSVTFATAAYGPGTLTYQWYLSDGFNPTTPVGGQTSSNMTFTTTAAQNGNNYQLVVSSGFGSVTSAVAQLTVVSGPPSFFVDLPAAETYYLGHVIQLRVVAHGTAPFSYQWQKNNVNITDDYRTFGSQTDTLTMGYAAAGDSGTYKCVVTGVGSTSSTEDVITVTSFPSMLFTSAGTGWSLQGTTTPIMTDNRLELSSGLGSTDRSAFMTTKQNVSAFNIAFVYQLVSAVGGADGITFCVHNDTRGSTVRGGAGGGLGYSGITPSAALALNIYDPNTRGIRFLQNGVLPAAGAGAFTAIAPVLIGGNNNPVQVNIGYAGGVLTASFRDTVTSSTYTTNLTIDIPAIVGSSSAYIGFTGADGGTASTQAVSNFNFTPPVIALKMQQVGPNLVLSWPAGTGAYLQSTPSMGTPVWTSATDLFRVVGSEARVTVTPGAGERFFRLQLFP